MKYKKKEFLIALIIICLIIIILLINLKNFSGNSKTSIIKKPVYNYTQEKKEEIKNEVINNISAITSEETTIDNLKKIVSQKDIVNVFLTTGENSYLRNKPSDEIIEKYCLSQSAKFGYDYYNCDSNSGLAQYNKDKFLKLREDFNNKKTVDYYYYAML